MKRTNFFDGPTFNSISCFRLAAKLLYLFQVTKRQITMECYVKSHHSCPILNLDGFTVNSGLNHYDSNDNELFRPNAPEPSDVLRGGKADCRIVMIFCF